MGKINFLASALAVAAIVATTDIPSASAQQNATSPKLANQTMDTKPIVVTIDGRELAGHLNDTSAANDLYDKLPMTLTFKAARQFTDFSGDLTAPLDTYEMSAGDDPIAGDIVYWSPQTRVVFFWGDAARYDGIHVIGNFDDREAASRFLDAQGNEDITATISK